MVRVNSILSYRIKRLEKKKKKTQFLAMIAWCFFLWRLEDVVIWHEKRFSKKMEKLS